MLRSSARAVAAVSRNVSFAVGGTATDATLDIPAHRSGQRLAAALLLAGSGPTDRNGNDIAANLAPYILQLIAGELARTGNPEFLTQHTRTTAGQEFAPGEVSRNAPWPVRMLAWNPARSTCAVPMCIGLPATPPQSQ